MAALTASDKATNDNFGISVSVYNDTAVVGAYKADSGGKSQNRPKRTSSKNREATGTRLRS